MKTGVIPRMNSREQSMYSQSIGTVNRYYKENNITDIINGLFQDKTKNN